MTGVTWLHLSDWHQEGRDFDRKIVLRALLKDIRERNKISPALEKIDFLIFSGDVAFGGKKEEYEAAKEQFFKPLLEASGLGPEQLFIVPGNHDLDRDEFKLLPHDLIEPLSTEKDVQDWLTDDRKRSRLLEPFREFASFARDYTKQDSAEYANIRIVNIDNIKISILGLNSAWMCGRNENEIGDYGLVIVGEPQIYSALDEIPEANLKIGVLHHPFEWLREFDRNRIENPLRQECDFILRGHQHSPKVEITSGTSGDCVIIPAGASYDRRIAGNPRYANSFNFVHLDFDTGKGTVFLRRWSDDGNKWLEDIASCEGGRCAFSLFKSKKKLPSEDTPVAIKLVPHQIPPPPSDFKGRKDEIRDILSNFEKGATITGLRGMGGVGKTALALVLAYELKDRFPDGQIFVEMRGTSKNPAMPPMTPEEAMAQIIRAFKPIDRLPENPVELRGLYTSTLTGKHVLLVLDNAASSDQIYPLLPPEGCSVLITSRIKFQLWGLEERDLDILPSEDARELLLAIASRTGDRADKLASLCGYLPLALRNAASALAEKKDLKVSEYEQRLKDKVARLELVKGSFSLSYDLLTPGRRKQWRRLSVFPEDFDRGAASAVLKMAPEPSAEALNDLVRWSLVDDIPTADSDGYRYKLHDLARLFAESCLEGNELSDAQQKHANYYSKVISKAGHFYRKGGVDLLAGLRLFDLEWPNIKTGHAWVKNSIRSFKMFNQSDQRSIMLLARSYANDGINILDLRLHPREQIGWLEIGLVAAKFMEDSQAEEINLGNLGSTYSHLGEPRIAIEFYEQALAISRKIGDRRGEGGNLGSIGLAHSDLGEPRIAIEFYEQALAIFRKIGDRRNGGIWLGSIGLAHSDLGETRKAIEFYEQALATAKEFGDRRNEGIWLSNLGISYSGLSEPRRAIEFYEQALKIALEIGDRRGEGNRLGNLGNAYLNLGEPRKAIEFHEQALAIAREIGDRRSEGADLGNLGNAYLNLGEPRKAIEFHEQALAIAREIGDRRNEEADLGNLGLAYSQLGEPRKAIEFYEQGLAIAQGISHRQNESEILCNLGKAYLDTEETDRTIEYCTKSLDISRNIEYRKFEGEALCTLCKALTAKGDLKKALEHCDQALKIFQDIEYPRGEAEALFARSQALHQLGQHKEAVSCAQQALGIFQRIESPLAEKVSQQLADWGSPQEN